MLKIILKEKGTKKPIPFVLVRIETIARSWVDDTDANGVAEFEIVDGKYNVKIRHADYRPYTERLYLSRNSIVNIKLHKAFD